VTTITDSRVATSGSIRTWMLACVRRADLHTSMTLALAAMTSR
jgi:hypothetical protein